jgi:hypothetical protein
MIRGWKLQEDERVRRALENLRRLVPNDRKEMNMGKLDVFKSLLHKERPGVKADDQLTFAALQAEIDECTVALKSYEMAVTEGLTHLHEIRTHITKCQLEQVKILSTVNPVVPGAKQWRLD